jgi:phosphoadenosine phosphosulfate reductase
MKVSQLLPSVRKEVEKPFEEKLARAKQLVRMFANKNACVSCSFGKDSTVVLWLCLQENPKIPVVYNNTGIEYPETIQFAHTLKELWNLNLIETKPTQTFWEIMERTKQKHFNQDDGKKHSNICCTALKHAPFHRVVKEFGFTHTFTGLTTVESRHRMFTACEYGQEYFSKKDGIWKIHPILYWTPEEVWQFTYENQLPENQAYQKYGLERIGCVPCTSHRKWREQLAKVNPRMYQFIQERYFGQKLLEAEVRG